MVDTNNVTITVKTSSVNAKQGEAEVDAFAARVNELAHEMLSHSRTEVHIDKHRIVVRE